MTASDALVADTATEADAPAIAAIRTAAAVRLTERFGRGHWSSPSSEKQALRSMRNGHVIVARNGTVLLGSLTLVTKKPWAIDPSFYVAVKRPLYLIDMTVDPFAQGQGIGRFLLEAADRAARAWPAQAIWLDAYDAPSGAGPFYLKCGYREVGRKEYRGVPLVYYEKLLT